MKPIRLTLLIVLLINALTAHADITDLKRQAENGDPEAQHHLGMYYEYGIDGLTKKLYRSS